MLVVLWNDSQSVTAAIGIDARKRSVWPIAHADMNPPERPPAGVGIVGVQRTQLGWLTPGAVRGGEHASAGSGADHRHPPRLERLVAGPDRVRLAFDVDRAAGMAEPARAREPEGALVAPLQAADVDVGRQHARSAAGGGYDRRLPDQQPPVRAEALDERDQVAGR